MDFSCVFGEHHSTNYGKNLELQKKSYLPEQPVKQIPEIQSKYDRNTSFERCFKSVYIVHNTISENGYW